MSRTQLSNPTMHARDDARRVIVVLVSLLWVTGSVICPAPLLTDEAAEGHGGSHGVEMPGEEHHHGGTTCEVLGDLNAATAQSADKQSRDQFWPGHYLPVADFAAAPSAIRADLSRLRSPGTGPPRIAWPRFTKSWPQAPPV